MFFIITKLDLLLYVNKLLKKPTLKHLPTKEVNWIVQIVSRQMEKDNLLKSMHAVLCHLL